MSQKPPRKAKSSPIPESVRQKLSLRLRAWRLVIVLAIVAGGFIALRDWWCVPLVEGMTRRALAARKPDQALAWLDRGAVIVSPTGKLDLLRARAYRHMGRLGEIETALDQARRHGAREKEIALESDLALAQAGQLSVAEPRLPQLLMAANDDSPEVCEAFVIGYMRTQRFRDALQLLEAWIGDWPKDPRPLLLRSRVWMVEQQTKRAAADLQRAFELSPNDPEITYELAFVHQQQNQWKEAARLYEACLKHNKWSAKAKLGLGMCYKALGDTARSEQFFMAAAQDAPENAEALREYGRHLEENGRFAEAVDVLQQAVKILPYDDELHYLLAQSLQSQGQREAAAPHFAYVTEARAAFRELRLIQDRLRKEPRDVNLLIQAGEILLRYSDPEEGVVRLMAALDQQPTNQRARELLVDHYTKRAVTRPEFAALAEEHRRWLAPSSSHNKSPADQ